MLQSINKKKIYLYLLFFVFLTTISNNDLSNIIKKKFIINQINIHTNSQEIDDKIKIKLDYLNNENIFFINKNKILNKIRELNFLENIQVKKKYPSRIVINAIKTELLASTFIDQKKYFVGNNGNFISSKYFKDKKNLPIIFGQFEIQDYIKLQKILKKNYINPKEILKYNFHKNKRWDLYFYDNKIILLPQENINNALKNFKNFESNYKILSNSIIDLRIKNRIILSNG